MEHFGGKRKNNNVLRSAIAGAAALGAAGALSSESTSPTQADTARIETASLQLHTSKMDLAGSINASAEMRERFLHAFITTAQENLKHVSMHDGIVNAIPDTETSSGFGKKPLTQLNRIIRAIETPVLADHLKGTSYDPTLLHEKYVVQMGVRTNPGFRPMVNIASSMYHPEQAITFTDSATNRGDYGNVLTLDPETYFAPAHVAQILHPKLQHDFERRPYDAALIKVTPKHAPVSLTQIPPIAEGSHREKLVGHFGVIVGFDPDATSTHDGRKTYAGVMAAVPAVPVAQKNKSETDEQFEVRKVNFERYSKSVMMVLPPGEAKPDSSMGNTRPAQGMSGSGVYVDGKLAGFIWATILNQDPHSGTETSIALILPLDESLEFARKHDMVAVK